MLFEWELGHSYHYVRPVEQGENYKLHYDSDLEHNRMSLADGY
jgi:hypothetical protein